MSPEGDRSLSHYRLIEKIGAGGMGVVWKAQDMVLGRTVAIKVLPADVSRDENRRRMFLEEARLASSVSDAHIAQVYDFGREGDLDFIVMEHVEGEALSQMLRGRPLAPERVALLGHQVAHAVSRAHRKGLLHRDLKPGNILVTPEGEAKVVDFGLATLFERGDTTLASMATTETISSAGDADEKRAAIAGTLLYMSPEQARAEKLDARSDIFSMGVVLYEMTTGQRPFSGATSLELLKDIVRARPTPPHELAPKMPLDLERIIQKALAPAKADRYQTMDDLAVDLKRLGRDLESGSSPSFDEIKGVLKSSRRRWLRAGAGLAAIAALAVGGWRIAQRGAAADGRTILLLPMEVHGQDEDAQFLGRSFAEAIAMNLAQAEGLHVLPVPSDDELHKGAGLTRASLAREFGAGRLLTGALTRDGSGLFASVSLVDAGQNRVIWGEERKSGDEPLPALAAAFAKEIAVKLGITPAKRYDHLLYPTVNAKLAAAADYSESVGALRRMDVQPSLASTERLVAAFPDDPEAHALRVFALAIAAQGRGPSAPERQAYERECDVLNRLDPGSPVVEFFSIGFVAEDGRLQEAADRYTRLLSRHDVTPAALADVVASRATVRVGLKNYDGALADMKEAIRLDPANDGHLANYCSILVETGHLEEALTTIRHARALNPDVFGHDWMLGWVLLNMKRWDEAIPPLAKSCQETPDQWICAMLSKALLHSGRGEEASEVAKRAKALRETNSSLYALAAYSALAGDRTAALDLLRRSFDQGGFTAPRDIDGLAADPDFASLSADPAFQAVLSEARKRLPRN
ncbi:MAG TPA: protein kinase [Patescibacteria group bacterium]|nr:protein kinase [Patescibacteria group bacterium]